MTKETMTMHKALSEREILEDRIESVLKESTFCHANRVSNKKILGVTIDQFEKSARSAYDKVSDMISRYTALVRGIHQSNSVTKVLICGEEYTVAEAISMKDRGIAVKTSLLNTLANQYKAGMALIQNLNDTDVIAKADKFISEMSLSGKETDPAYVSKVRNDFIEKNSYELVDPLGIRLKIEELQDWVDKFTSEVDSALSVSNAITTITIEY